MATVTRYVDPDAAGGGTGLDWANAYTSLSAWEAAEQTDLVSDGDSHVVWCRSSSGTADTAECVVSGWTCDSSHTLTIRGFDFPTDGIWDDTKYVLHNNNDTSTALTISTTYTYVYDLQVKVTMTYSPSVQRYGITANPPVSGVCYVHDCLVKGVTTNPASYAYGNGIYASPQSSASVYVWNCVVQGFNNATSGYRSYGFRSYGTVSSAQTVYFWNCTSYGNYYGFGRTGTQETTECKNCISGNNTDDFSGTFNTIDYCCSDDGDGTHAQTPSGGNWANEVNNAAGFDFNLVLGGNCIDNGTDNPGSGAYSDDIRGKTRT